MREQFIEAQQQNPDSEISKLIYEAEKMQVNDSKNRKSIMVFLENFRTLGKIWWNYENSQKRSSLASTYYDKLHKAWDELDSTPFLVDADNYDKRNAILIFAEGSRTTATPKLVGAISDMLGYETEKRTEFYNFVYTNSSNKTLNHTPEIVQWFTPTPKRKLTGKKG